MFGRSENPQLVIEVFRLLWLRLSMFIKEEEAAAMGFDDELEKQKAALEFIEVLEEAIKKERERIGRGV